MTIHQCYTILIVRYLLFSSNLLHMFNVFMYTLNLCTAQLLKSPEICNLFLHYVTKLHHNPPPPPHTHKLVESSVHSIPKSNKYSILSEMAFCKAGLAPVLVRTCANLLIFFANSLDPDQVRQNVGPDLDPNCLTLRIW